MLRRHYRNDRVGFVILCWVFASASASAGVMICVGWTEGGWIPFVIGIGLAATIMWLLHIATTD